MTDSTNDDRNPLFRYEDPIFRDEALLRISHLPERDRIVGRDDQLQRVAEALNPAIFGSEPNHLVIFGKTGSGKTLISRAVTQMVQEEAQRESVDVAYVLVDCGEFSTETAAVRRIAAGLNEPEQTNIDIPHRGIGTGTYYDRLWRIVDQITDVAIIMLDEIDMLEGDELLRKLSRATENRRVTESTIGIIGISNKINYPDSFSERVKSSFSHDELVFPAYNADQLIQILEHRKDAFQPDVLAEDVIPLTAALAAQEHGDARKAIDILRNAGRIAKRDGDARVTEAHVRTAKERAEINRFAELIEGTPMQSKVILYSLSRLHQTREDSEFSSKTVYDAYQEVAGELEVDAVAERRVRQLMQELDFLNVIDSSKVSRGRGRGVTAKYRLLEDADIVQTVLERDERFETLA